MLINNLQKIYNCFGYENILICGGLADYFWINYTDLNDIDLIVNINAINTYFNISWPKIEIKQSGFEMKRRTSSKFIEKFYQGKYLDTKIDIFLVNDFHLLNRDIILTKGSKFGIDKIFIDSAQQRIELLHTHLNYEVTEFTEKWERDWIKFKKIKATQKLEIYNVLYGN